ncbi:energy transducer TonB family protein [Hydrogenivirga sp.]
MLRSAAEEVLYWVISILINLILLSLLATVFIVKVQEVPEIYPLRVVDIKEIEVKKPKRQRSVVKAKSTAKKTVSKRKRGSAKRRKVGATVTKAHEKGDVKVPVQKEEDVSVLAALEKRIESRLKERKTQKKEVGALSAVVTAGQVKIKGGSRSIVYTPPAPELVSSEFPSSVRVRIWVAPDGKVIKALLLQRSGNVNIDNTLLSYVRAIKFERVEDEEVQVGEITFSFRGG